MFIKISMIWVEKEKKCIFLMKALLPYSCISLCFDENMFFIYKKIIIIKARSDKKKIHDFIIWMLLKKNK